MRNLNVYPVTIEEMIAWLERKRGKWERKAHKSGGPTPGDMTGAVISEIQRRLAEPPREAAGQAGGNAPATPAPPVDEPPTGAAPPPDAPAPAATVVEFTYSEQRQRAIELLWAGQALEWDQASLLTKEQYLRAALTALREERLAQDLYEETIQGPHDAKWSEMDVSSRKSWVVKAQSTGRYR